MAATFFTILLKSIFSVMFCVCNLKSFSVSVNIPITSTPTYHKPPLSRHLTNLYRSSVSTASILPAFNSESFC